MENILHSLKANRWSASPKGRESGLGRILLAYPSQRETWDDRAARRADRIREKLKWQPGILKPNGWIPKGMHWSTFERLTAQHQAFVQLSLAGAAARFNLLDDLVWF